MPRQKKDHKAISIKLDKSLFVRLEEYCDNTYLTKTAAIEKALSEMLEKENKEGARK